jgi:hypothetical protein
MVCWEDLRRGLSVGGLEAPGFFGNSLNKQLVVHFVLGWSAARFIAIIVEHEVAECDRCIERHLTEARICQPRSEALRDFHCQNLSRCIRNHGHKRTTWAVSQENVGFLRAVMGARQCE